MKKVLLFISFILITSCSKEEMETKESPSLNTEEIHFCSTDDITSQANETGRVSYKGHYWVPGQIIKIKFLNGDAYVQNKVKQIANQWVSYANVKFAWVASNQTADIKIAFKWNGDTGSWSIIGKYAANIAQNTPSMNFGWFDSKTSDMEFNSTTLHEFGHALGLGHEHLNPTANIQWNKPYVYAEYAKQGWNAEKVDFNVLNPIPVSKADYTIFDKKSIMLYPFPASFTLNNYSTPWNIILSDVDKASMGILYPFPSGTTPPRVAPNKSTLYMNQSIQVDKAIVSQNNRYWLVMHNQGNLVIYDILDGVSKIIWDARTYGNPGATATMQSDGNFVVSKNGQPLWSTKTNGKPGSVMTMQNDGIFVISLRGVTLWKSR